MWGRQDYLVLFPSTGLVLCVEEVKGTGLGRAGLMCGDGEGDGAGLDSNGHKRRRS